jgi:hypothetical protein
MAKGNSGRIVIEVSPDLKGKLYRALAADNSTLKDWFLSAATAYINEREQPSLRGLLPQKQGGAIKQ